MRFLKGGANNDWHQEMKKKSFDYQQKRYVLLTFSPFTVQTRFGFLDWAYKPKHNRSKMTFMSFTSLTKLSRKPSKISNILAESFWKSYQYFTGTLPAEMFEGSDFWL